MAKPEPAKRDWKLLFLKKETGAFLALTLIIITFQIVSIVRQIDDDTPHYFISPGTAGTILTPTSELGIVAIGATMLMVAGEFDLSVGAVFALSGIFSAKVTNFLLTAKDPDTQEITYQGFIEEPWLASMLAFFVVLIFATSAGLLNGILTLTTRIPSFIVTLGSMLFWRGLALFVAEGRAISIPRKPHEDNWFLKFIGDNRIDIVPDFLILQRIGVVIFWFIALVILFWYIMNKTKMGNWIFATGGKKEAARAVGIPVNRVKLMMFSLTGFLAGLAGAFQFARSHSMSPIEGTGLELEAIAASVIGGAALTGGVGTIIGTMLGAMTMRTIRIGLPAIGLDSKLYQMVIGVILVSAVVFNQKLQEISERRR